MLVCDVKTSNSKNQKGPKMNYTEIYRKNVDSLSSIDDEEYTDNEQVAHLGQATESDSNEKPLRQNKLSYLLAPKALK